MATNTVHDRAESRKADPFTFNQFTWLRQIAYDSELSPVASRVAIALTKYFSRKKGGWSWMAHPSVADDLGVSVRTVGSALSDLVKRGHLLVERRGMTETNRYHIALREQSDLQNSSDHDPQETADHDQQDFSDHGRVIGKIAQSDRQDSVKVIGKNLPTNPLNEPTEEPIEEDIYPPRLDFGEAKEEGRRESKGAPDIDVDFDLFYLAYPKHVDRADALTAYKSVIKKKLATPDQLLAAARRYGAEQASNDPKYIKGPASWLRKQSWLNEPAKPIGLTLDADGNPITPPPNPSQRAGKSWMDVAMSGLNRGQP